LRTNSAIIYIIVTLLFFGGCSGKMIKFQSREILAREIIDSINTNDKKRYLRTFHPKVRKGFNRNNMVVLNHMFDRDLGYTIPDDAKLSYSQNNLDAIRGFGKGLFEYPVEPTTALEISYNKSKFSSVHIVKLISNDEYGWYQVIGVPNEAGVKKFKEGKIRQAQMDKKIAKHIASMDQELYQKIVWILKISGSVSSAHRLHMKQTKIDESFSIQVIKQIRKKEGLKDKEFDPLEMLNGLDLENPSEKLHEIDLSGCLEKNCISGWAHAFKPEELVLVRVKFGIIKFKGEDYKKILPVFYFYNYSSERLDVEYGLQLLNEGKQILVELTSGGTIDLFDAKAPSHITGRAMYSTTLLDEDIVAAKYVKVIYRRIANAAQVIE